MSSQKIKWVLIFFLLLPGILSSNPLPLPQAFISELTFNNNGDWVLEISFQFSTPYQKSNFDSICVRSSYGYSRVKLDNVQNGASLFVITSDSLDFPLKIINNGDCIKLISYTPITHGSHVDSLIFGNAPGSTIGLLPEGYSFSRYSYNIFCKDKSPSIGSPNDTSGICGLLTGEMFDKNNIRITNGEFKIDFPIVFNNIGVYSTPLLARKIVCNRIQIGIIGTVKMEQIDSLCNVVEPDSVYYADIHFKDYVVGVNNYNTISNFELTVMNYPNPFNASTTFLVHIPDHLTSHKGIITIFNSNGNKVRTLSITNNSVQWDGKNSHGITVSSGVYYYHLSLDNTIRKSGSVVFLK